MPQFDQLTPEQQWWLEQARIAVSQANVTNARVSWLAQTHNAVFAVESDDATCVLMLQKRDDAALLRLISQKMLMGAIRQQEGIALPSVVDVVLTPEVQGMLTRHLEGDTRSPQTLTAEDAYTVGAYLAQLHMIHPEMGSAGAVRPVLDADGLFGENGVYDPGEDNLGVFTGKQLLTMQEVAAKVRAAMETFGKREDEFGIIHADLLLHNILFDEGHVRALDWEYSGWGYYLYDLTPLLWQMKPQPHYAEIEAAVWEGYTSLRALQPHHRALLETFIAGRQVASMRWVAANQHNPAYKGKVERILAQRTGELQHYLKTGTLNRST